MDLSCGYFYKTIEKAKTAIKQHSKSTLFYSGPTIYRSYRSDQYIKGTACCV